MNIRHWLIRSLIALSLVLNLPAASLGGATAAKAQDASILAAGDENWDNRFGLPGGEGGEVNSVAVTDNGDIYIAGRFTQSGQVGNLNASLSFPPGAVSEPIRLNMTPATDMPDVGGLSVLGQGFHIEAHTLGGAPLTLVVHYNDADVVGVDENTLQIYFWDEVQAAWVALGP